MPAKQEAGQKRRRVDPEDEDGGGDASDGSYVSDDSDSEVEFLLGPTKPGRPEPDAREPEKKKAVVQEPESADATNPEPEDTVPASSAATAPLAAPQKGTLDIDAIGTLNGQPIVQFPPSSFADKPWRRPGADISDYFNYGLDEFTWMAYCNRQDKLRAHFTAPQLMQSMGMPMMPAQFMMPPMGMPMPMGGMPMPMGSMPRNPPNGQGPQ